MMETITVVFEVYVDRVEHTTITAPRDVIARMASGLASVDDTFCIRSADGTGCICDEYGLREDMSPEYVTADVLADQRGFSYADDEVYSGFGFGDD